MIGPIIIIICSIILFVVALLYADTNGGGVFVFAGSLFLLVWVLMLVNILEIKNPTPTALDVYRGKTTLEITCRDSVAVDSVVVYKKLDYGR